MGQSSAWSVMLVVASPVIHKVCKSYVLLNHVYLTFSKYLPRSKTESLRYSSFSIAISSFIVNLIFKESILHFPVIIYSIRDRWVWSNDEIMLKKKHGENLSQCHLLSHKLRRDIAGRESLIRRSEPNKYWP